MRLRCEWRLKIGSLNECPAYDSVSVYSCHAVHWSSEFVLKPKACTLRPASPIRPPSRQPLEATVLLYESDFFFFVKFPRMYKRDHSVFVFSAWLISLSITPWDLIHVVTNHSFTFNYRNNYALSYWHLQPLLPRIWDSFSVRKRRQNHLAFTCMAVWPAGS